MYLYPASVELRNDFSAEIPVDLLPRTVFLRGPIRGQSIKYVTLEGGGGPRKCDSLWQRGDFWLSVVTDVFWQKGVWTKPTPDKTFQTKDPLPWQKPPDKSPREPLRENLYRGLLSGFFVLGLLKIGGRDVWRTFGGSRDVWQSVTEGGGQNSVTYFMDGP